MTQGITTSWWALTTIAVSAFLFAWSFALYLRELGADPLRPAMRLFKRPLVERFLLVFFVCGMVQYGVPRNPARLQMYGAIRDGDSSCPNFLVVNHRPVLLGCHLFANSAPSILLTQGRIQKMMDELSDENGMERYQLDNLDLSVFERVEKLR